MSPWRTLGRLATATVLSVGVWLLVSEPLGWTVRGITVTLMRLAGEQELLPDTLRHDAMTLPEADHVGIVVKKISDDERTGRRIYFMPLMRWYVNVIVLPVLALSLGRASVAERLLITGAGVSLLLLLDGCTAFLFLLLAARRLRDAEVLSATFHASLEHGLAVYATRILPVAVWAMLYFGIRRARAVQECTPAGDRPSLPGPDSL